MNQVLTLSSPALLLPEMIAACPEQTVTRFLGFFSANTRNPNTRNADARAAVDFHAWCADRGLTALSAIQPIHVAGWMEELGRPHSVPTGWNGS
ncbi:hypothetical protein [Mesorhizobium sp. M0590]|uniref:hypothetical protein n=1 Tax=unclassified Mesorhizobium TaxID=325217 RepID=UPI003336F847